MVEFKHLRLSCQGSRRSEYEAGMFDGEGAASAKREAHETQISINQSINQNFNAIKATSLNRLTRQFIIRRDKLEILICVQLNI